MEQMCTVTFDRALAHFAHRIDLNPDRIIAYYEALPYPGKRPLKSCHIHISALLVALGSKGTLGVICDERTPAHQFDPQAPATTDILLFIGSIAAVGKTLAEGFGHELAHYANPTASLEYTPEERRMRDQIWFYRSGCQGIVRTTISTMLATILWLVTSVFGGHGFHWLGWLTYTGTAILTALFVGRRRRRTRIRKLEDELFQRYRQLEHEQAAFGHAPHINSQAVTFVPRANQPAVLFRPGPGHRQQNRLADLQHRIMSLHPPAD